MFVVPVEEYWMEQEIDQWVHQVASVQRPTAPQAEPVHRVLVLVKGLMGMIGFQMIRLNEDVSILDVVLIYIYFLRNRLHLI